MTPMSPRPLNAAALGGLLVLWAASPATAQVDVVLDYSPCRACTIEATRDIVLDDAGAGSDLRRMADGRIVLASAYDGASFMVYPATGGSAERVGRAGEGPGEYRYVRWVRPHRRSPAVFDGQARRLTVLDASFDVVRTVVLPGIPQWDAVVLDDSTYVVNMVVPTSDRIGYALHTVDGRGKAVRSFDELPGGYGTPGSDVKLMRNVGRGRDGTVWSAHYSKYQVDLWNPATGGKLRSLVRNAEWFPEHVQGSRTNPEEPALPRIIGVAEDQRGRLWIMISVASDGWPAGLVKTADDAHPEFGEYTLPNDLDNVFDTVVEVIDPVAGRVIASATFDEAFLFVGAGWAASQEDGASLAPRLQIWRLTLNGAD